MPLSHFFNPRSVAVVGASDDPAKVGFAVLKNLKSGNPARKIYPVSLTSPQVQGIPAFKSVLAVPDFIDLAVIAVRSDAVPQVLAECGRKGIASAIVISAGFREIGEAGIALDKQLQAAAKKYGISFLGPNCFGVVDAHADLNTTFAALKPTPGSIAVLSQSGATGAALLDWTATNGIGLSKFISLGNESQLTEIEFLEYLGRDPETDAILLYLEKVSDGKKFLELAGNISRRKPIIILKAGRTARGQMAALSHTGSLAAADDVFMAACRQSGAIVIDSIRELFNFAKLFHMGIRAPLRRLIVLTNAGGPSIITSDLIELSKSLELAELDAKTKTALRKVLPPMAAFNNPIDLVGDAQSSRYEAALKILAGMKNADAIIAILTPQMMTDAPAIANTLAAYRGQKPIIPIFLGGAAVREGVAALRKLGMANFDFPKDAVEVLDLLAEGRESGVRNQGAGTRGRGPGARDRGHGTRDRGQKKTATPMPFKKMAPLLQSYGIKLSGTLVRNPKELSAAWKKLKGAPAAMKAISPDFSHKSDAHAVALNVTEFADAEKTMAKLIAALKAKKRDVKIEGVLVQPMGKGKETIIGMKRDSVFGPTVIFGMGGIFAEALRDTSLRIAPVSPAMAAEMIGEIKGSKILCGLRGEKPVRIDQLAKIITGISRLALAHPEVKEIDLNPVMAGEKEAVVVDARIII